MYHEVLFIRGLTWGNRTIKRKKPRCHLYPNDLEAFYYEGSRPRLILSHFTYFSLYPDGRVGENEDIISSERTEEDNMSNEKLIDYKIIVPSFIIILVILIYAAKRMFDEDKLEN
jgi:hypothetical protein